MATQIQEGLTIQHGDTNTNKQDINKNKIEQTFFFNKIRICSKHSLVSPKLYTKCRGESC